MWGAGAPTALGSGTLNLSPSITWNKSANASNIATLQVDSNLDIDSTSGGDTDGDAGNDTDQSCTLWNNDWNASIQEDGEINSQDNDGDASSDGQTCVDSNLDADYINVDTDGDAGNDNDEVPTYWGGTISGQTSGEMGLQMALQNIAGGSVAVKYPVAVTQSVTVPGNYVKSGDQVTFTSSWQAQSGASLTTTAATGAAGLNGVFGLSASASGSLCVSSCSNDTLLGVSIPNQTYTLFSPVSAPESASGPGVAGAITGPSFGVGASSLAGNTLTATGTVPFWQLDVSLGGMVQGATHVPLNASASVAGVNFGYDVMSGAINPTASSAQTLTFTPTVLETLTFSSPVGFTTYDAQGNAYGTGTSATLTFPADGKAVITVPSSLQSGSLTYSTAYAISSGADFTNNSSVQANVSSNFSALSLNASFPNAGALKLGPVYQTSGNDNYSVPLLGSQSPFGATASSWNLGGFSALDGTQGSLSVDSIPPVTTASVSGPAGHGGWHVGPATVTLAATDNSGGSGVADTYYSVDGGPNQTYSAPFTISQDGTHSVHFYSVDNAGNQETTQTLAVAIDQTAPTTTESVSGTEGTNGWYKAGSPVVLTLSAIDNPGGSGVAATDYSVNDGPPQAYTAPVTFTDGVYTIAYGSTDVAGNVEAAQTVSFKVDQTPPVVAFTGNNGAYTVAQTVDITCSASDNLSGVASTTCTNVDVPAYQLALGSHALSATATDNAGNTGSGSTTWTISVMSDSLCQLTTQFESKGGVANSLCGKLNAAAAQAAAGNAKGEANILSAYENELAAQSGKSLSAAQVAILDGYVADLENQTP